MNIIRSTKWALLELFPEQKETEAAAEETAWNNALAAEAEAEKAAEEEKAEKKKSAADAAEQEGPEESASTLDQIEADMAAIDLTAKGEEAENSAAAEEPLPAYDPEVHDVPLSELPEGHRPDGVIVVDYASRGVHLDVQCTPAQIVDATRILDEEGFCLESVAGVDWIKEEQMEVLYDFSRLDGPLCRVVMRTRVPRTEPVVPTVSDIFPGANWHERETHEFFGIRFEGHPNLTPLLLPEDADFHPLRKDFTL